MATEESGGGPPPRVDASELQKTERTRIRYVEAMAVGMGANPLTARLSAEGLVRASSRFAGIDFAKNRDEQDPQIAEQIKAVGKWCLNGSPHEDDDEVKWKVGSSAMLALTDKIDGDSFNTLIHFVNQITDGKGGNKIDKILHREEE